MLSKKPHETGNIKIGNIKTKNDYMTQTNNMGLCGNCRGQVPAKHTIRDGKVYLTKDCPACGTTEALVSSNAEVWQRKREVWGYDPNKDSHCNLRCGSCIKDHTPAIVFIETTNRCNMQCPICIASVQAGTEYHPPLEYFEKLFKKLATFKIKPFVELYGGEPTVRDDLFDIIKMAKSYGLRPRVVTNGLKLADENYCRKLCETKVRLRVSFDGSNPEIYRRMRRSEGAYDKKLKALENIKKYNRYKHTILSCVGCGFNDDYVGDMIEVCHKYVDAFDELGIIPLKQDLTPDVSGMDTPTTIEDIEAAVQKSVPDGQVEFISAGLVHFLTPARSFFTKNRQSDKFMFGGAHPNCESATFLVSDGQKYRSINHYLKIPLSKLTEVVNNRTKKLNERLLRYDPEKFLDRWLARVIIVKALTPLIWISPDYNAIFKGRPIRGIMRLLLGVLKGERFEYALSRVSGIPRVLRVGVLPFEQYQAVESNRLANCKGAFVYEDTADGQIKFIPTCTWFLYRQEVLKSITAKYGIVSTTVSK
jgi:7,8-dihydro-6-hydroxymethylpterin dimethyltransferase